MGFLRLAKPTILAALLLTAACGAAPSDGANDRPAVLAATEADGAPAVDEVPTPVVPSPPTPELALVRPEGPDPAPIPLVLFDTDLGPDIDDALALAMLHGYDDRKLIELGSVTISRNSVKAARYAGAFNTFGDRPDLPVGIDRAAPYAFDDADSYVSLADEMPGAATSGPVADAVPVLRRALLRAIEEGRPVLVVQVGFSGNLAALLDSGADDISERTGVELVADSGAVLSIMAGTFDAENGPKPAEFNVAQDIESARRLIAGWPGRLILSPYEVGADLLFPYTAIRDRLPGDSPGPAHPVRQAYEFRDLGWHVDAPPFYDMRTWDLTSVLQAVEPDEGWFPVSVTGRVTVAPDGSTTFEPGPGRHRVLETEGFTADRRARAIDRMIELVTEPA